MLESVEVVYCTKLDEEGVMVCFLHRSLLSPPIGKLEVPQHLNETREVKNFVEELARRAGYVVEEDPHHEGVFHIFRP